MGKFKKDKGGVKTNNAQNIQTNKKLKNQMKPKKKSVQVADKNVRMQIASGELVKDELTRLVQRDLRSLYIRFSQNSLPSKPDEIKQLHSDIKFVRTPRLDPKGRRGINYAFVEFGTESECKAAKNKLSTTQFQGSELFVDFVGAASRSKKQRDMKDKSQFNPTRLFISGLAQGVTKSNLKAMFPKCSSADIPANVRKKGTAYGFIQFSSPSDAKAAFDAAQNLEVAGHPITVLFAKRTAQKDDVVKKKKAEKRKIQNEKKNSKKSKTEGKIVKDDENKENDDEDGEEEENDDDDDNDDSEEDNDEAEDAEDKKEEEDDENDEDTEEEDDADTEEEKDDNDADTDEEKDDNDADSGEENNDQNDEEDDDNDEDDDDEDGDDGDD